MFVLTDEPARFAGQQIQKMLQIVLRQRSFEVFDDIELDVSLAQDVQRAA